MLFEKIGLDMDLLTRYDVLGPRYTSYPTVLNFLDAPPSQEESVLASLPQSAALSLYVHLPFCESLCFYCGCHKIVTRNRERLNRYLKYLCQEISLKAAKLNQHVTVSQLHFGGGTPTYLENAELTELMFLLAKHFRLTDDENRDYSIEIDPRRVNNDTIALLHGLGFNRISIGIQDFDFQVLKAINREQNQEEIIALLKTIKAHNFSSINVDLIYGLPKQSPKTFSQTIDKIIDLRVDRIAIYNYAHLPERIASQRLIHAGDLPTPYEKLQIISLARQKLLNANYCYIGMDHFAKPSDPLAKAQRDGTLQRNFQGYTTHRGNQLIGFGISAISFVNDVYLQNHKTLSDYYACLDEARLPTAKGYVMNADDKIRSAVIMQLICHLSLDIQKINQQFGINFFEYFHSEQEILQKFSQDHLLKVTNSAIEITPVGQFFIRNIAMVFDRYLQKNHVKFSRVI